MMKAKYAILLVTVGLLVSLFVALAAAVGAQADNAESGVSIKALAKRIEALERIVGAMPAKPPERAVGAKRAPRRPSLVARLDALERQVRDLARGRTPIQFRGGANDLLTLQQAVTETRRQMTALARRLDEMERRSDARRASDNVRDLKRDVDRLRREVDDLKTRVRRVESRR